MDDVFSAHSPSDNEEFAVKRKGENLDSTIKHGDLSIKFVNQETVISTGENDDFPKMGLIWFDS